MSDTKHKQTHHNRHIPTLFSKERRHIEVIESCSIKKLAFDGARRVNLIIVTLESSDFPH